MNLNNLTIKSQEALQQAIEIAQGHNHQIVDTGHMLKALFNDNESITSYLIRKIGIRTESVIPALDAIIERYPRVSGGSPHLSNDLNKALQKAQDYASKMGDQFVSVEHLLLGLTGTGDNVAQLLKDKGLSDKELQKAIDELRKGEKVSSQTAEATFDSLNRFAVNLNEQAHKGKLDPVIGRDEEIRRVLQILSRRTKNNPILVGEPGVGKTAIAEGIAHRIISGDVAENLKSKQIFSLDMGALIAGAKYKEDRCTANTSILIWFLGD